MRKADQKRRVILTFIATTLNKKGYPPTVREICEHVGLSSTSTVHAHLKRLQNDGLILKDPAKPRTLELTTKARKLLDLPATPAPTTDNHSSQTTKKSIPLVGLVTAGTPILATQNVTDYFPCPPNLAYEANDLFMLKIRGDSMIEAGILDGDYVIVRKQPTADNGDIVIALVNDTDEATCKKFYRTASQIRLQPCNETLSPFFFAPDEVAILGLVKGVYRELN